MSYTLLQVVTGEAGYGVFINTTSEQPNLLAAVFEGRKPVWGFPKSPAVPDSWSWLNKRSPGLTFERTEDYEYDAPNFKSRGIPYNDAKNLPEGTELKSGAAVYRVSGGRIYGLITGLDPHVSTRFTTTGHTYRKKLRVEESDYVSPKDACSHPDGSRFLRNGSEYCVYLGTLYQVSGSTLGPVTVQPDKLCPSSGFVVTEVWE